MIKESDDILLLDLDDQIEGVDTEDEVNEIITKNLLASKGIPFKKLGEYAGGGGEDKPEAAAGNNPAQANASASKAEATPADGGAAAAGDGVAPRGGRRPGRRARGLLPEPRRPPRAADAPRPEAEGGRSGPRRAGGFDWWPRHTPGIGSTPA